MINYFDHDAEGIPPDEHPHKLLICPRAMFCALAFSTTRPTRIMGPSSCTLGLSHGVDVLRQSSLQSLAVIPPWLDRDAIDVQTVVTRL
jgi:hypothetical protein